MRGSRSTVRSMQRPCLLNLGQALELYDTMSQQITAYEQRLEAGSAP